MCGRCTGPRGGDVHSGARSSAWGGRCSFRSGCAVRCTDREGMEVLTIDIQMRGQLYEREMVIQGRGRWGRCAVQCIGRKVFVQTRDLGAPQGGCSTQRTGSELVCERVGGLSRLRGVMGVFEARGLVEWGTKSVWLWRETRGVVEGNVVCVCVCVYVRVLVCLGVQAAG